MSHSAPSPTFNFFSKAFIMITVYLCLSINTPDLLAFPSSASKLLNAHSRTHHVTHYAAHPHTQLHTATVVRLNSTAKRLVKRRRFALHDATHIVRCCAWQRVISLCIMAMRCCWVKVGRKRKKQKGKKKTILEMEKRLRSTPVYNIFLELSTFLLKRRASLCFINWIKYDNQTQSSVISVHCSVL